MIAHLAPTLLVTSLLFTGPAWAQDEPAPPPTQAAGASTDADADREQTIRDLEATVAELKRTESEAQRVRRELSELRDELRQLQDVRINDGRQVHEGNDRVSFGQPVIVEKGDEVDEVVGFGDDVHVRGVVRGDATSFGGSVVVFPSGVIRGDAVAFGGDVRVEKGGSIEGSKVSLGVPGVSVVRAPSPAMGAVGALASDAQGLLSTLYRRLVLLLSFAGAGVLVVGLFPSRIGRIASTVESNPFRSAFVGAMASGFLGLFSLIFAVITLGLGLPVSLMVVAVLGLAWLMGFIGLCQAVGDRLPFEQKPHGRWLAFLIGTILITTVSSLPLVGWLVVLATSSIGIGAALSSRFGGS